MSVEPKPNGRFRVRVWDPALKKRVRVIVDGEPEDYATRAEADAADKRLTQIYEDRKTEGVTVGAFLEHWLTDPSWAKLHGWRDSTIVHYRQQTKGFRSEFGPRKFESLKPAEFARIVRTYGHHQLAVIKTFFKDAADAQHIHGDPFYGIRSAKREDTRKNMERPTERDVRRMLDLAYELNGPSYHAWLSTAAWSGCRPAEVDLWEWDNLDLDAGRYHVTASWSPKSKKPELPKNGEHRYALVPDPLVELLSSYPREGRYCFLNSRGHHWTHSARSAYWSRVRVGMGWGEKMRCYDATRHHLATWLVEALNMTPEQASLVIGQTDGGSTLKRHYLHLDEERALAEANKRMRDYAAAQVISLDDRRRSG